MRLAKASLLFTCVSLAALPVARAQSACAQTSALSYRADPGTGNVEKRTATETQLATTCTFSNYSTIVAGSTTTAGTINDVFQLTNSYAAQIDGRALVWRQNNTGTGIQSGTPNATTNTDTPLKSKVLLTFSREVSNLTLVIQDIDRGTLVSGGGSDYTDEVDFYATNSVGQATDVASTGAVRLGFGPAATSSASATCAYLPPFTLDGLTQVGLRGTGLNGTTTAPSRAGNVTITFTNPIKTLLLTYRNLNTASSSQLRLQTIGIEQMSWCSQADLTTAISVMTVPAAGSMGRFGVSFSNVGDMPTGTVTAQVQLPRHLADVTATNGGTYDATTGIVTYSPSSAALVAAYRGVLNSVITYRAPAKGTVIEAVSSVSSPTSEGLNPNPNIASASTTTTAPLPVVLTAFTARASGPDARLAWATASEHNSDYFAVERSANGVDFVQIGRVAGRGTVLTATTYAYADVNVAQRATGTVYYRLRQVDLDGTTAYSPVQALALAATTTAPAVGLYPNPAVSATVTLDLRTLPAGTYQATLLNALGAVLATAPVSGGQAQALSLLTGLPSGAYLVLVQGQGLRLTQRLARL